MKKLGVIGGMGAEASSFFYARVTERTKAEKDQDHIDIVLLSHATMPDRTKAILTGEEEEVLQAMREDVKALEMLGVGNIAVTCNTAHYFIDKLKDEMHVPVIHMVEESVRYVKEHFQGVKKIGIMGTNGTIQSGTYFRACEKNKVEWAAPSKERQEDVMSLIYDDIKAGKEADTSKFERAYADLKSQGCDAVILACTELSVYREYHEVPSDCIDAMDVLVTESILRSGAQLKEK